MCDATHPCFGNPRHTPALLPCHTDRCWGVYATDLVLQVVDCLCIIRCWYLWIANLLLCLPRHLWKVRQMTQSNLARNTVNMADSNIRVEICWNSSESVWSNVGQDGKPPWISGLPIRRANCHRRHNQVITNAPPYNGIKVRWLCTCSSLYNSIMSAPSPTTYIPLDSNAPVFNSVEKSKYMCGEWCFSKQTAWTQSDIWMLVASLVRIHTLNGKQLTYVRPLDVRAVRSRHHFR
jgi:hypothetical protein